jgi:hypothetical protein
MILWGGGQMTTLRDLKEPLEHIVEMANEKCCVYVEKYFFSGLVGIWASDLKELVKKEPRLVWEDNEYQDYPCFIYPSGKYKNLDEAIEAIPDPPTSHWDVIRAAERIKEEHLDEAYQMLEKLLEKTGYRGDDEF